MRGKDDPKMQEWMWTLHQDTVAIGPLRQYIVDRLQHRSLNVIGHHLQVPKPILQMHEDLQRIIILIVNGGKATPGTLLTITTDGPGIETARETETMNATREFQSVILYLLQFPQVQLRLGIGTEIADHTHLHLLTPRLLQRDPTINVRSVLV